MSYHLTKDGFRDVRTGKIVRSVATSVEGSDAWNTKQQASLSEYEQTHSTPSDEALLLCSLFRQFIDSCMLGAQNIPEVTLDIGCGEFKDIPPYAVGAAAKSIYIGSDPIATNEERKYFFVNARAEDLSSLFDQPFANFVILCSVLDHIEDLNVFYKAIRSICKPGARIVTMIGIHESAVLAESYGRYWGTRVMRSLRPLPFVKNLFVGVLSALNQYRILRMRNARLAKNLPLDALHFHYFTQPAYLKAIQPLGQLKRTLRVPGTNWLFTETELA